MINVLYSFEQVSELNTSNETVLCRVLSHAPVLGKRNIQSKEVNSVCNQTIDSPVCNPKNDASK